AEARLLPVRIVPAESLDLDRRGVEQVDDVPLLAPSQLDADWIDQDQPLQAMRVDRRDFSRDPPPERQSDQRDLVVRKRIQYVQVQVYEVVHRVKLGRAWRVAEARVRRRHDLGILRQQIQ